MIRIFSFFKKLKKPATTFFLGFIFSLVLVPSIDVVASTFLENLKDLNILEGTCIIPGFPDATCQYENSFAFKVWEFLVRFAGVVASAMFVFAGYKMIINDETEARKLIASTIYGLGVVLASDVIVNLIGDSLEPKTDTSNCVKVIESQWFGTYCADTNAAPVIDFFTKLLNNLAIPIALVVAVVFFVIGLYNLLLSGGNSSMVQKGWEYMRNSIIGFVAVFLGYTILSIIYAVIASFFPRVG